MVYELAETVTFRICCKQLGEHGFLVNISSSQFIYASALK